MRHAMKLIASIALGCAVAACVGCTTNRVAIDCPLEPPYWVTPASWWPFWDRDPKPSEEYEYALRELQTFDRDDFLYRRLNELEGLCWAMRKIR